MSIVVILSERLSHGFYRGGWTLISTRVRTLHQLKVVRDDLMPLQWREYVPSTELPPGLTSSESEYIPLFVVRESKLGPAPS